MMVTDDNYFVKDNLKISHFQFLNQLNVMCTIFLDWEREIRESLNRESSKEKAI